MGATLSEIIGELKSVEPIDAKAIAERKRANLRVEDGGRVAVQKRVSIHFQEMPGVPASDRLQELASARGMPWRDDYAQRAVPYWASDERVDQHGDIVLQNWVFDEFEKNSPMPFNHQWDQPPVGRVVDWQVMNAKAAGYEGRALWLLGIFATKDEWEWADTILRLTRAGILKGGSVGFVADVVHEVKDPKERERLGLGKFGFVLDQNHLLEFSPTTIGANQGAHAILAAKSQLQPYDLHMLRELKRLELRAAHVHDERARWFALEAVFAGIGRTLWPDEPWTVHRDLDVPVTLENAPVVHGTKAPPPPPAKPGAAPAGAATDGKPAADEQQQDDAKPDVLGQIQQVVEGIARAVGEFQAQVTQVLGDVRDRLEAMGGEAPKEEPAPDEGEPPGGAADDDDDPPADEEDEDEKKNGSALRQALPAFTTILSRLHG